MTVDRIFLDANILFSVAYGSPGLDRLWSHAELHDPEHLKKLETCLSKVQIVPEADQEMPCPIDLPEKDRPVLLAASSIKADYLITGDMLHFGKYFGQTVSGVKICRARDYLRKR